MAYMIEKKDMVKRKVKKDFINPLNRNERRYNHYEIEEYMAGGWE